MTSFQIYFDLDTHFWFPHLLQLFRRILQFCFAVKLQKHFVGDQTFHLHECEQIVM